MYLTIALIVLIPISARVYHYLTARQVKRVLREQFGQKEDRDQNEAHEKR